MDECLRPIERIRKQKDFTELYRRGRRLKSRYFHLVFQPNGLEYSRMAVVVSKKIGKATVRNRIKRRFKELFRRNKHLLRQPCDLIFIAQKEIPKLSWEELQAEYKSMISRLDL
ncbi:MAG: ribonuclease P protein component [Candidatus Saccharicenans sp.]|nr:ribonuclease P protein component [Candidatus Saccharicenans sp.]